MVKSRIESESLMYTFIKSDSLTLSPFEADFSYEWPSRLYNSRTLRIEIFVVNAMYHNV